MCADHADGFRNSATFRPALHRNLEQPRPQVRRRLLLPAGSLQINDAPPATGWPAIAAAAKQFMTSFPDLHIQMDNLVIHADHAIYH
jgi:hypothetical protein